jgi:superoxide dismutase, Fe-Mn family
MSGGGHLNHSIFWENLAPVGKGGGEMPAGDLQNMINAQFGSLDGLQKTLGAATVAIQGSGWGWLGKLLAFCYPSSVHSVCSLSLCRI